MTQSIVKVNQEIHIVKLEGKNLPRKFLVDLKNLLEMSEDFYPGIDIWFERKVKQDLKDKKRIAFLVYHNKKIIGETIFKRKQNAKICSLRVLPEGQMTGIGSLLMILIAKELKNLAERIYGTIPSELWFQSKNFFERYGFVNDGIAKAKYRSFDEELACSADFMRLRKEVIQNFPTVIQNFKLDNTPFNAEYDLIISIRPEFVKKILLGEKRIEIRRRFAKRWEKAKVLIYSPSPIQAFVGEAVIDKIITACPKEVWSNWKNEVGCTFRDFMKYCNDIPQLNVLTLSNIKPFKDPTYRTQIQSLVSQKLCFPQSHCEIRDNNWIYDLV